MSSSFSKKYIIVPLIYVAVIFGLMLVQFSRGNAISETVNGLQLAATRSGTDKTAPLSDVRLKFNGLELRIGGQYPLYGATGTVRSEYQPQNYEKTAAGFRISCSGGLTLTASTPSDRGPLSISAIFTGEIPELLNLAFLPVDGGQTKGQDGATSLVVSKGDLESTLTLPANSRVDLARRYLVWSPIPGAAISMRSLQTRVPEVAQDDFFTVYSRSDNRTSSDQYNKIVSELLNKAYTGWKTTRFNAQRGTWLNETNSYSFSEKALVAFLAEALKRREFPASLAVMEKAASLNRDKLTYLSSAFLGDLQTTSSQLLKSDAERSALLLSQVNTGDFSGLSEPGALQFAFDRAKEGLFETAAQQFSAANISALPIDVAVGLALNYATLRGLPASMTDLWSKAATLPGARLYRSMVKTDAGYFVKDGETRVNLILTAQAGKALRTIGASTGNFTMESLGLDLLASVARLADENGFVPRTASLSGGTLGAAEGRLAPEYWYDLLTDNPYYPRFQSLQAALGRGAWMYVSVPVSGVDTSAGAKEVTINLQFPAGLIHHLFIKGVKPYRELKIIGLTWRIDPQFERYPLGALYSENRELLLIKYRHKNENESVFLRF